MAHVGTEGASNPELHPNRVFVWAPGLFRWYLGSLGLLHSLQKAIGRHAK